ncbi:MAG: PEP-CTERM sorting domain-containing protein [Planctomycetes bacterium]|nr:PEP-CTERM sorting domain-containing protein [Planctomycetota bacterium]
MSKRIATVMFVASAAVLLSAAAPAQDFLLIPDSTADTVGMYDPYDGTYLGDLINGAGLFSTPINAVPGPGGNIYVSDQVADSVFVFDKSGNYLSTYADNTDGLNNIRGIDFRNGHLFVTSGDDYVAEFDGPHSRLPDFIADGSDPFDILFLDDGRALLADIAGTTDNIRLYQSDGTLDSVLFQVSFPEQVQFDSLLPGGFLNASFSDDVLTDFALDGTISETTYFNSGRGVFRLGNGHLLATAGDGVWEVEPKTGNLIEMKKDGSMRFIEYVPEPASALLLVLGGLCAYRRR